MVRKLAVLASAEPIVSTYGAGALEREAGKVARAYDWHAATYVEQPPLGQFRETFATSVKGAKTPKGCLVGGFGYGKTATAIGLWQAWQREGFLVVPPVSCASFPDVARAVRDWVSFTMPTQAHTIASAHESFLQTSAETLARRDERDFGIAFEQGIAAITDKLERGYLDFEDVSLNLLTFLDEATKLALAAGRSGLIVIVDEFQQLLGNATKGTLVALRQLIWGLRTRETSLGLILTMDPDTERTLADRAGDILHRIKDDGYYLNLQQVYDREFPAKLWGQYVQALSLDGASDGTIDRPALEALGQLCEREDLSNGPRTVINALRSAASRPGRVKRAYSPLDLIDDLLSGKIRFDGDRSLIPSVVGELLSFPYFQRSPELASTLKLVAAFPRGCPEEIAAHYGLQSAWQRLAEELRGEIVTELDEGLTLVELQRVGRPANRLNILLRRYWMQITDLQLFAEEAQRAFVEIALPILFPPKKNDLNGWWGIEDVSLSPEGDYRGILEGTPSPEFPLRRIAVRVTGETPRTDDRWAEDVDFHLTFTLSLEPQTDPAIHLVGSEQINVEVALGRSGSGFRGGLKWIEHYLSPQPITPALVISLLRYLARERGHDSNARDQARIDDAVSRLEIWLAGELFPPSAFTASGHVVVQAGAGAFHEFLFRVCRSRWQEYRPLAFHQHWGSLLGDYEAALQRIPPSARAGVAPVRRTKAELAELFGQAHHAGFESRARQYGELLKLESWRGDEGELLFRPHPGELVAVRLLGRAGRARRDKVYRALREAGNSASETRRILRLAEARGLLVQEGDMLAKPRLATGIETSSRIDEMIVRLRRLGQSAAKPLTDLAELRRQLRSGIDVAEVTWQVDQLERSAVELEKLQQVELNTARSAARQRLLDVLPGLQTLSEASPPRELANHMSALHIRLESERKTARADGETFLRTGDHDPRAMNRAADRIESWLKKADAYSRWVALVNTVSRLQQSLERLGTQEQALASLAHDLAAVIRDSRAVLSQAGIGGLPEVGRLELALHQVETTFSRCGGERARAYDTMARELAEEIRRTVGLADPPHLPGYDAADDAASFSRLRTETTTTISREVALWGLHIAGPSVSKAESLLIGKLRADIRDVSKRARDPDWLLAEPRLKLSSDAVRVLKALHRRVVARSREIPEDSIQRQIADALSMAPSGQTELSTLIERASTPPERERLLRGVLRLGEDGTVRILIELNNDGPRR